MTPEREEQLKQAIEEFHLKGSKPTDKPSTGKGAGLFCEDFTWEQRNTVHDALVNKAERRRKALDAFHEKSAQPTGKEPTGAGAGIYGKDFTPEQRSDVCDALDGLAEKYERDYPETDPDADGNGPEGVDGEAG
jgi:hypothetical protein